MALYAHITREKED